MVKLDRDVVKEEIVRIVGTMKNTYNFEPDIDGDFRPGIKVPSQVLLSLMVRVAKKLEVIIPDSCYIFYDKKNHKQLSIEEAVEKLINFAEYAN